MASICRKDTVEYLRILDKYINSDATDRSLAYAYYLKSLAYKRMGDYTEAINSLKHSLDNYTGPENIHIDNDTCEWLPRYDGRYCIYLSHLCLTLEIAELLQKERKPQEALYYLGKLDRNKVMGYSGCVNGQIMIEIQVALAKADCYLNLSDTLSAIKTLVEYCPFDEGEWSRELIERLKPLLYSQYTETEIKQEILNSIENVEVFQKSSVLYDGSVWTSERVSYTLFGVNIPYFFFDFRQFQDFVKQNRNLEFLMEK